MVTQKDSMDVDYSKPNSSQISRDWNEFKNDKYKILFPNTIYNPKPALCSFDIDDYFFDPFF